MKGPRLLRILLFLSGGVLALAFLMQSQKAIEIDTVTGSSRRTWHWLCFEGEELVYRSPLDEIVYSANPSLKAGRWKRITTIYCTAGLAWARGCSRAPNSYEFRYLDEELLDKIGAHLKEAIHHGADRQELQRLVDQEKLF